MNKFLFQDYAVTRLRHYQYLKEKILVSGPLFPDGGVKRKVTQLDWDGSALTEDVSAILSESTN